MIDYFSPATSPEEQALRRIKGNFRLQFVRRSIAEDGLDSVPSAWLDHDISEVLKNMLQAQHPQARGGEDLPDLNKDEVEIARLTLANSVHGEVTSLRARPESEGSGIALRMVDEYGAEITLPAPHVPLPLTPEEIVSLFQAADPSPTETSCEVRFHSWFYPNLNEVAGAANML
jgi:hypothetical protein